MSKEMLRGHLDMLVLSVIARRASYGYAIVEQLRLTSGAEFDLPEGSLYPALYRLEADGWLRSEWTQVDGRKRRIYHLTRSGRRELARRTEHWLTFSKAIQDVLEPRASA